MAIYKAQSKRKTTAATQDITEDEGPQRGGTRKQMSVWLERIDSTGHNLFKLLELLEPLFLPQQTATQSLALVSLVEHQTPACHTPARTSRACCMSLLNEQSILRRPEAAPDLENY